MAGEGLMDAVPVRARAYVTGVALAALVVLRPLPETHTPWWAVLLLAGLYAGSELVARSRFVGTCYPVLLAGAFLLPPPAAALVALPGALLSPVAQRPYVLRRIWRAAQLTLAVWAAARVTGSTTAATRSSPRTSPTPSCRPGPPYSRSAWC